MDGGSDRALPVHYRDSDKPGALLPTPGVKAVECSDRHVRSDMERVEAHKRFRREQARKRRR